MYNNVHYYVHVRNLCACVLYIRVGASYVDTACIAFRAVGVTVSVLVCVVYCAVLYMCIAERAG